MFVALHGPGCATRVGFVAPPDIRFLLVLKNERDLHEAVKQLAVVGYDQVFVSDNGGMGLLKEAAHTRIG